MDITPGLKAAILCIRDALDQFASKKGWRRSDYYLGMIINIVWLQFVVDIHAKEYDLPIADENVRYDEVYDFLEEKLKDDVDLRESISILLSPYQFRFSREVPLGENHIKIEDDLLNPGAGDPPMMSPITSRDEA